MYGLQIMQACDGLLPRGTVYITLVRLTEKNLITSRYAKTPQGEQGPPRRWYKITSLGLRTLKAHPAPSGAVYIRLVRLSEKKPGASAKALRGEHGPPGRRYRISALGLRALKTHLRQRGQAESLVFFSS